MCKVQYRTSTSVLLLLFYFCLCLVFLEFVLRRSPFPILFILWMTFLSVFLIKPCKLVPGLDGQLLPFTRNESNNNVHILLVNKKIKRKSQYMCMTLVHRE